MNAARHLDDIRLSALIDGEAAASDAVHAAECADCGARLAVWQEAHRRVATPPEPPPAAQREAAVAAALAQLAPGRPTDPVVSLDDGRRRRRVRWGRIAAAAAAVVVVAGVTTAIVRSGGGSGPSTVSKSAPASPAAPSASASTAAPSASAGAAAPSGSSAATNEPSFGPAQVASVGEWQGPGPMAARLRAALAGASQTGRVPAAALTPAAQAAFRRCLGPAAAGAGVPLGTPPVLRASVTYHGAPAEVFVFAVGAHHVAEVTDESGCGRLARVTF
jgi:hypothetical protein